jgi:hypothetical protein
MDENSDSCRKFSKIEIEITRYNKNNVILGIFSSLISLTTG